MDIDKDMMMNLANQLGLPSQSAVEVNQVEKKAEIYKNKSDEEILREIAKLKETIKKDRKAYEQQVNAIKALSGMMNKEQSERLQKILTLLEE